MPELIAENLGLRLPVHAADSGGLKGGQAKADERFIFSKAGRPTGFKVLDGISFHLEQGDRLGIVGRNGAGKSMLLKLLGRIYDPTSGRLVIDGSIRGIFNLTLGLKGNSSGYRNIELMGLIAGLSMDEIRERIPEIVDFTELGGFLDMPVHSYSSGMRMRLLFATITSLRPDILLLDEWLGTGDIKFRRKATKRMEEMVQDAGILVLASHNLRLLSEICNKIIWLDKGRIRMAGTPDEIIESYSGAQNVSKKEAMETPYGMESEYE